MQNEMKLLPHFLTHYRKLGVENFIIHDDHSTDGSCDFLSSQPDCSVLKSTTAFNTRLNDGRDFHHFLKEFVPESIGAGRWVIVIDMDEFLVLPPMFESVPAFQAMLDQRGHTCVFGTMVDAYPETLRARNHAREISPFEGSPYFDRDAGFLRQAESFSPQKRLNGIRARLITALKQRDRSTYDSIFAGRGYMMPALYKVPFIKTGTGITRFNSHTINRQPPFDIEVALVHFKFGPDLDDKIATALVTRNHYLSSIEYQFLAAVIDRYPDENLISNRTLRFDEPGSLLRAGFTKFD